MNLKEFEKVVQEIEKDYFYNEASIMTEILLLSENIKQEIDKLNRKYEELFRLKTENLKEAYREKLLISIITEK